MSHPSYPQSVLRNLPTETLRTWIANHEECISVGINVGQIDRNKAQAFRLELTSRS